MSRLSVWLRENVWGGGETSAAPNVIRPKDFPGRIWFAMEERGYKAFTEKDFRNIVYVEGCTRDGNANANRVNAYDDVRILLTFVDKKPVIERVWHATTQPGIKLTQSPVAAAREKGAAIICHGQQTCWQTGMHRRSYDALVQTGAVVGIHRDKNKDYLREGDIITRGLYGINQHHGGNSAVTNIGGHSAGCLVTPMDVDHQEFMKLIRLDPRYIDNDRHIFDTTVMPFDWIKEK